MRTPVPGVPQLATLGCSCMAWPMAWPVYSRTTEYPPLSATCCTACPTSPSRLPSTSCAMPAASDASAASISALSSALDLADRGGEGRIAVPAVDDGAAVDRHDVALVEHDARRRGCRGRSPRSARRRSPPGTRGTRGSSIVRRAGRARRDRSGRVRRWSRPGGSPDGSGRASRPRRGRPDASSRVGQVSERRLHGRTTWPLPTARSRPSTAAISRAVISSAEPIPSTCTRSPSPRRTGGAARVSEAYKARRSSTASSVSSGRWTTSASAHVARPVVGGRRVDRVVGPTGRADAALRDPLDHDLFRRRRG